MDDYNISAISEAKNEYSARLVNILTPLFIEGIKSIFKEALELCIVNDEKDKYLMTFQNFLTRVPKWNQSIITQETTRIISKSKCNYLEDLVTCVHISQLKILTSIRVASKQKKVDINVPKLTEFIHLCYVQFARKLYSNVYLFETKIASLQMQKNHRECELLCKECILNVIRSNIPVDKILRAYIDETVEEEIIEESKTEEKPIEEELEIEKQQDGKTDIPVSDSGGDNVLKSPETMEITKNTATATTNNTAAAAKAEVIDNTTLDSGVAIKTDTSNLKINTNIDNLLSTTDNDNENSLSHSSNSSSNVSPPLTPLNKSLPIVQDTSVNLSFSDNDKVINYNKKENSSAIQENTVETIIAPKTLQRLEEISTQRNEQRKRESAEDGDGDGDGGGGGDEKIKIFDTPVDMKLDDLDVHVLDDKINLQKEVLKNVVELK